VSTPFLDPDTIGAVALHDALAAIDLELRLRDSVYPRLVAARKLSQAEAERRYRGLVGARRVVLAARQLELPLGRTSP
jgi:hypothetical protein